MRCRFCFATFKDVKNSILPKGHLPEADAIDVVLQLAEIGFEKITFAGGEPTLCPWLPKLISTAKQSGMTTMVVTNGSKLTPEFLKANQGQLDWIALSVDSLNSETNKKTGRAISGTKPLDTVHYKQLTDAIKQHGYGLKINTVVNRYNCNENMSDFIHYAQPERWKIFQVLPMIGQNDAEIQDFLIAPETFQSYLDRHKNIDPRIVMIPEANEDMKGSYAMVDPAGRFYDNMQGTHHYSRPITEIGARLAIQQVNYSLKKFTQRGGLYVWERNHES
jgi:radical S-adenosyl methionine domain-containing protein 2